MRLNHNTMAYTANTNLKTINNNLTKSMQRLSSGYKINKSSDDPAGNAISQRMRAQIRGLERAENNANDGISLIQTGEGALNEIHSILARIRELAVKGANEIFAEEDLDAMQDEINQLLDEIDRISETTDFNGRSLLNGELNKKGYTSSDALKVKEIGGDIEPGEYGLSITSVGTPATATLGPMPDPAQEGMLVINDFQIKITEGMTAEQLNARILEVADKIGMDYIVDGDTGVGTLTTRECGSKQSITVSSNIGLNGAPEEGITVNGTNAEVSFTMKEIESEGDAGDDTDTPQERIGFKDTATIETQGNRVTITDKNGFKMVYDINPDAFSSEQESSDDGTVNVIATVLSAGPMVLQIGNNEGQTLNINIEKTTSTSLDIDNINVYTHAYASTAVVKLDAAVDKLSGIRSSMGAYQNRLDHILTNLETAHENLSSAVSRVKDTDMAEAITEYTQMNVLSQSALQMLMKSNARPEGLLQLFQR